MFSLLYSSCKRDTILAFAADRRSAVRRAAAAPLLLGARRAAIDRYCLPAVNQPNAAAAVDRWDRRTDGRTPDLYIDPASYFANSVNNCGRPIGWAKLAWPQTHDHNSVKS